MRFAYPWVLLALLLLGPLAWFMLSRPQRLAGFGYGAVGLLRSGLGAQFFWLNLANFLRLGVLACLILAAARPQIMDVKTKRNVEGLDIVLALDTSNSMQAMDFELNGDRQNRLAVVKHVVEQFIQKRVDDRIGLVIFGSQAFTQAPLTLDHRVLLEFLKPVKIGMAGPETAIGDALATAVKRLKDVEAQSKIIILLTDGENTAGSVDPRSAGEAARTLGIKVYAIGVGSDGPVPYPTQGFFGIEYQKRVFKMDTELMKWLGEATGGKFFLASDTAALEKVYATIDQLEKTKKAVDDPRPREEFAWVFLIAALVLFAAEQGLAASRLEGHSMSFAQPQLVWLLLLLAPLLWGLMLIQRRYERRLLLLTRRDFQSFLLPAWALRVPWVSWILMVTAVACILLALARPRYGFEWRDVKKHGADVVIVLDVSRSMNAADINPSRLVRAKREILDLLKVVRGDRLGLVLFAGVGFIQCPLTQDMQALELFLEQVDSDSIPVQGTSMGQAIRLGMKALQDGTEAGSVGKAMIVISDGEDQETDPVAAAKSASEQGVVIHTISVGGQGAPIPLPDGGFLKDDSGGLVVSKPDETTLRQIAEVTGGYFLRSETGDFGLDRLYRESIRPPLKESEQSQRERVWNEIHHALTGLAAVLLIGEVFHRRWRTRSRAASAPTGQALETPSKPLT